MEFRHEYKHYLNYMDYLCLKSQLRIVMMPDRNVNEKGEYKILSLYFDNYENKALREKLDGVNTREKFRIRYYNNDTSYISLEKKTKINGLSNKQSVRITKEEVEDILQGNYEWMAQSQKALIVELYSKMKSQLLRPKTIVDYIREPFIYEPGNVRVTIDREIRTGIVSKDFFNPNVPTITAGEPVILLEVKYDEFLPEVIEKTVQLAARRGTAFSKYAVCRIYG